MFNNQRPLSQQPSSMAARLKEHADANTHGRIIFPLPQRPTNLSGPPPGNGSSRPAAADASLIHHPSSTHYDNPSSSEASNSNEPVLNAVHHEQGHTELHTSNETEDLYHIDFHTLSLVIGWKCIRQYDQASRRQRIVAVGVSGTSVQVGNLLVSANQENWVLEVWKRFRPCGRIDGIHVPPIRDGQECMKIVLDFGDQASAARALAKHELYSYEGTTLPMTVVSRYHYPGGGWVRIRPFDWDQAWEIQQSNPPQSQLTAQMLESNNSININGFLFYPAIATDDTLPASNIFETCAPIDTLSIQRLPPIWSIANHSGDQASSTASHERINIIPEDIEMLDAENDSALFQQ
ncbi:hypothetical protein IAU59_006068 [Kwoniella sp. CBS 9459]